MFPIIVLFLPHCKYKAKNCKNTSDQNKVFKEYSRHKKPIEFVTLKRNWFSSHLPLIANIVKYFEQFFPAVTQNVNTAMCSLTPEDV